jgi:hypothetical protein
MLQSVKHQRSNGQKTATSPHSMQHDAHCYKHKLPIQPHFLHGLFSTMQEVCAVVGFCM